MTPPAPLESQNPPLYTVTIKPTWFMKHPGAAISLALFAWGVIQWIGTHAWIDANKPRDAEMRGIRRDIRTIATFQLESARANRELYLADKRGVPYERPPEPKRC